MECVSTWPLLQRNKIEDSKINVAVQAIADTVLPEEEVTASDTFMKSEETPKLQEIKTEPPNPTNLESTEQDADQSQSFIKSERAESADISASADDINDVTPMTVDEPNLESERGRTSERHESQTMRLKRLSTKVYASQFMPS
jgi:hypothetical protein